ncbi:phosphatase PAP2 family protein [Streptomyces sp. NPDC047718]|uniref:bifunctional phosphatase PAP2/diacylglycerol kinase family protein n=1 Tax=Streptomyces sp. NPDC047718 TaxID=3155479 RepID=UPI0033F6C1D0
MSAHDMTWRGVAARWDRALFDAVAQRHWPGGERVLPRLGRAANHGVLWGGAAAVIAACGSSKGRGAAVRALGSLALASATINTVGKWSVRRARPVLEGVPAVRQLATQPATTSFPSGHSASAFAFTTGLALHSPGWGIALAPVAASVAFSRVYTGVHYPSDVAAGAVLGVAAGFVVRRLAARVEAARSRPGDEPVAADAPALPDGAGLVVVANAGAGSDAEDTGLDVLRARLPEAEVIECDGEQLAGVLADAASRAAVLGVCGGDGTINAAATAALRAGVPLAVFPGGTLNHFAQDLGLAGAEDTCRAVAAGRAVRVAVGRFTPTPSEPCPPGPARPEPARPEPARPEPVPPPAASDPERPTPRPGAVPPAAPSPFSAPPPDPQPWPGSQPSSGPVYPPPGPGPLGPGPATGPVSLPDPASPLGPVPASPLPPLDPGPLPRASAPPSGPGPLAQPGPPAPAGEGGGGSEGPGEPGYFLNTFSIGAYPELLRYRMRWQPRIGYLPAAVLAAWRVLRTQRPVRLRLAGRPRSVWLLFAGNGTYHGTGATPRRRNGLGETLLDVRIVHGGGRPGLRLLAAAFAGPLSRSPVHSATRLRSLHLGGIPAGTPLAYDGEYAPAPDSLVLDTLPGALTVYRDASPPPAPPAHG